jgi:hypothetical protein
MTFIGRCGPHPVKTGIARWARHGGRARIEKFFAVAVVVTVFCSNA